MEVLVHPHTGRRIAVKRGFCWTMLFFGVFVPLFRGDIKWFLITLVLSIITGGWAWLIFPFFYNHAYIEGLLDKGYRYA